MASRGKNSGKGKGVASSSSSSATRVGTFLWGPLFHKNLGPHSQEIDDNDPNIDITVYNLGLDDQLSDDDVEEIPPTQGGTKGSQPMP